MLRLFRGKLITNCTRRSLFGKNAEQEFDSPHLHQQELKRKGFSFFFLLLNNLEMAWIILLLNVWRYFCEKKFYIILNIFCIIFEFWEQFWEQILDLFGTMRFEAILGTKHSVSPDIGDLIFGPSKNTVLKIDEFYNIFWIIS